MAPIITSLSNRLNSFRTVPLRYPSALAAVSAIGTSRATAAPCLVITNSDRDALTSSMSSRQRALNSLAEMNRLAGLGGISLF